jgi:hypothetical protein
MVNLLGFMSLLLTSPLLLVRPVSSRRERTAYLQVLKED